MALPRRSGSISMLEPVEQIDDAETFEAQYKTIRLIGSGASGRVMLVEHRTRRHKCVLKIIPMNSMRDAGTRGARRGARAARGARAQRLAHPSRPGRRPSRLPRARAGPVMKEVTVLAQLDHANVTRYYGSWHHMGSLHILMEYADGGSLADAIRARAEQQSPLDEDVVMDWFIQIVRAVHYIHERHIVHRDLKAANVLLTTRGLIKVCDFGIAKVLEETSGGSAGFASTCIGTPYYLSPEIVEAKPYGLPTDVWSLGVLLFEMAALKKPFEAESLPALAMCIMRAQVPALPEGYSDELRELVQLLLDKEPARRPTVGALRELPFFSQHEDRFDAQLQELAQLAYGLASQRASFASPPFRLSSAPAPTAAESARASAPPPGARPAERAAAAAAGAEPALGSTDRLSHAPAIDALPGRAPPTAVAPSCSTVGRSAGAAGGARGAMPAARGVSLPGYASPSLVAGVVPPSRGSVGQLLHVPVTSPQEERALARALRHELVLEGSAEGGAAAASALRASLEANVRFSLNMAALEENLAAALEEGAEGGAGAERDAPAGRGAPPPAEPPAADAAAPPRSAPTAATPAEDAPPPPTTPLPLERPGFVTTRRSKKGDRKKSRMPISSEMFAPPEPDADSAALPHRPPLQDSNVAAR